MSAAMKPGGSAAICAFRSISEHGQLARVDGVQVDLTSARIALRVYDALSSVNRQRFEALPVAAMILLSMKTIKNATRKGSE